MPALAALADAHQERLLARADRTADAAERAVRAVWLDLLAVIRAGGPWFQVHAAASRVLRSLPGAAYVAIEDLVEVARDSAKWTAGAVVGKLDEAQRARVFSTKSPTFIPNANPFITESIGSNTELRAFSTLLETERGDPESLLVGLILPPIGRDDVLRVIYAAGWTERLQALTRLAAPEALASRIATLVTAGESIAKIAREIRPLVQGVQASARRVARTAGLWVAHSAELTTYEGLSEIIEGYQVHAVLDHATRPEHRKRDGTKYYRVPKAGQKGFEEMPRPPREADGSWAFNCRCYLSPILAR